jgi:hypothetical protein
LAEQIRKDVDASILSGMLAGVQATFQQTGTQIMGRLYPELSIRGLCENSLKEEKIKVPEELKPFLSLLGNFSEFLEDPQNEQLLKRIESGLAHWKQILRSTGIPPQYISISGHISSSDVFLTTEAVE